MTSIKTKFQKLASFAAFFLTAVLFVNANTASSGLVYQPKAPNSLDRFSKIR